MALIIDGKAIAQEVRAEVAQGVAQFKAEKGVMPGLHVILVGNDPASETYVRNKELACADVGMHGVAHRLPESTDQATLERLVDELNADGSVHGILVQLPLPKHLDALSVLAKISADKDVDGLHQISAGRLLTGYEGFVPCTPRGIMRLIESTGEKIAGKEAVVIGRSNLVGKPVSLLLLNENATVTMCHSKTRDLAEVTRRADILVAAIGRPEFVTGDMIKPGAIVIDVGTTRVGGKLKGDVNFEEAKEKAGYITPVPGGVGPMTIAMLLSNTLLAARRHG